MKGVSFIYQKQVTVVNPTGLHARPASDFVALAKTFSSRIKIRDLNSDDPAVNAKSIVLLLSLGLAQGAQAELSAEGEDAQRAVEELAALISSGFGEV